MHPNPIAKARFENQKAMYEEEDKKLKERWEKERAAEKSAARGKGARDDENVFEKIGRDYAENAQSEQEIEDKRWEGFGDFFAKEGGTAGQRQAPGFNYGGRESEHSGRSRSDNMALAMGVEEELLDKIAAEAKEKKGKDIFTEGIESSVWSTSAGITGLADMFIGKPLQSLGWEDNFISEWNKYYQDKAEEKHQDVMDAAARTGKGKTAETAAVLVEMLGEAGIDALLGMVTGGISLAGKGGKVLKYADDVGDLAKMGDFYYEKIKFFDINSPNDTKQLKEYLEKINNNSNIRFSNEDVREWYVDTTKQIHNMVDCNLTLEEKAYKAFELRNEIRTGARKMMADSETRKMLEIEHRNLSFEERIYDKMKRKDLTREEAIEDIYETAVKTNKNVNKELGIIDE